MRSFAKASPLPRRKQRRRSIFFIEIKCTRPFYYARREKFLFVLFLLQYVSYDIFLSCSLSTFYWIWCRICFPLVNSFARLVKNIVQYTEEMNLLKIYLSSSNCDYCCIFSDTTSDALFGIYAVRVS